ncbi:MAG: aminoacyl-tRNA hydrolase [Candidatus Zixiibacteriota bacterium]
MISLIVGLGNIGKKYIGTRHNLGFEVVDLAIKNSQAKPLKSEFFYQAFGTKIDDRKVVLAKPTTMMNGCGGAVIDLLDNFDLTPSEMLVVVDDFNIPLGALRLRPNGSDGGHNGLESIIDAIQSEDVPRLRLGIGQVRAKTSADQLTDPTASCGRPDPSELERRQIDVVDFVLGKFKKSEEKIAKKMIDMAAEAVIFAAGHRFDETMSKYNHNPV